CIDKAYRNKGLFRMLYQKMVQALGTEFEAIVTEVDTNNLRSLKAHHAIGFEHLKTHKSEGKTWELVVLKI
ncbi:MAG: GNAT family N-acetyltransferase, partial [Maribacter sp.]|nr:GNAT family N-acetyltransferase [Maribacter sp.]